MDQLILVHDHNIKISNDCENVVIHIIHNHEHVSHRLMTRKAVGFQLLQKKHRIRTSTMINKYASHSLKITAPFSLPVFFLQNTKR
jgi:hypothetical protein